MKGASLLWLLAMAAMLGGCMKEWSDNPTTKNSLETIAIPPGFNYSTTREFSLALSAQDNHGVGLKGIPFSFSYRAGSDTIFLGSMLTAVDGTIVFRNVLPDYIDTLQVTTEYPGIPNFTKIRIEKGMNTLALGGYTKPNPANVGGRSVFGGRVEGSYNFLSSYDASGVPNNLEPVNDYIPQDLLDLINNSLPEKRPVPQYNPEYLGDNVVTNIQLKDSAEVWVTFVTEGAGYMNTLGYYTYSLEAPPKQVSDIKQFTVVFPNVSLPGSGGNLQSGSKVKLGVFSPNTGIGWFLIPNGWNGKTVAQQPDIKYSDKVLNTFTSAQYQQQVIILKDATRQLLLLSFEDLSRPGGDNDFNDAVFFVTANPFTSVISDNISNAKPAQGSDKDGDGVLDKNDAYPNDPERAFDVYTPGKGVFGSLAFEDNWPSKGDYDMNDLVIDYSYHLVTNASNAVVDCDGTFQVRAMGAAYKNGFGVQWPVPSSNVLKATSSSGRSSGNDGNGLELNQSNAVLILFDNAQDLFGTSAFVNTVQGNSFVKPVTITSNLTFVKPVPMADIGYVPFNPFIFVNGDRTAEVHLPDMLPTDAANLKLLGTQADSSVPDQGRYYKSGNNLPWAINIAQSFDYPLENRVVSDAFVNFATWAKSAGIQNKDWYTTKSGNRDDTKIYKHP
ncbi:MAG: LruC domain-containing protein [Cyclobacteriaceae bacterium]|nr:LruC domain-containing protein [Cyclobacteriaceae bacterium]